MRLLKVDLVSKVSTRPRVYSVKGKNVVRRYRVIPYDELVDVLRRDDEAFLEDGEGELKLKRGTVWRAARRLSELVGKPVRAERAFLRLEDGSVVAGYSFSLEKQPSKLRRSRCR